MLRQRTLKSLISASGVGLHTGPESPASRCGPRSRTPESCSAASISPRRSTFLRAPSWSANRGLPRRLVSGEVKVHTVEHLMSALGGLGVDNAYVDLDAPELPIMDGSAAPFVLLIQQAGIEEQAAPKKFLRVTHRVEVRDGDKWARLEPYEGYQPVVLDRVPPPGDRAHHAGVTVDFAETSYLKEIARARTFGFMHEVEDLRESGLALGGGLDNAVVLDEYRVLNSEGLRFADEFIRHKLLDAIGDLYLLGSPLLGSVHRAQVRARAQQPSAARSARRHGGARAGDVRARRGSARRRSAPGGSVFLGDRCPKDRRPCGRDRARNHGACLGVHRRAQMAAPRLADLQVRRFRPGVRACSVCGGGTFSHAIAPLRRSSASSAARAGDGLIVACRRLSESSVSVENCAAFCAAAACVCDAFGCTRTETELTCQRWLHKKRLREGASSLSLAAAAEFAASKHDLPVPEIRRRGPGWPGPRKESAPPAPPARGFRALSPAGAAGRSRPERIRSILGRCAGNRVTGGSSADYPDLGPAGQGEVSHAVAGTWSGPPSPRCSLFARRPWACTG